MSNVTPPSLIENLNDQELLLQTEICAQNERSATSRLIEHLREIERRKVYCDLGLGSLHAYCHKHLKLSEGSAQRRINVLKLTADLPELKTKIESGEMSLTVAARLQSYFQHEGKLNPVPQQKKLELAREVAGKSRLEVEKLLRKHSVEPERHHPETIRTISETHVRISFNLHIDELLTLERARGLLAHLYPEGMSWQELTVAMARNVIETRDPAESIPCQRNASPRRSHKTTPADRKTRANAHNRTAQNTTPRTAGAILERELWKRDHSQCTNCGSWYRVQKEHHIPWAMGGPSDLQNMRLLCRNCNLRAAIRQFGLTKIEKEQKRRKATNRKDTDE